MCFFSLLATRRTPSSQGTPLSLATPQRPVVANGGLDVIEESPATPSSHRNVAQSPFTGKIIHTFFYLKSQKSFK